MMTRAPSAIATPPAGFLPAALPSPSGPALATDEQPCRGPFWSAPTASQLWLAGCRPWGLLLEEEGGWSSCPMGWASASLADLLPAWPALLPAADLPLIEARLYERLSGRGWRSEAFALIGPDGAALQHQGWPLTLERSVFRLLGLLAESVQLNLVRPEGDLWIAQRAAHKAVDPLLWDAVVAGGLPSGEEPAAALMRECGEEAGLMPPDLLELAHQGSLRINRLLPGGSHHLERVHLWQAHCTASTQPEPRDGEVEQFRLASPAEVEDLWRRGLFNHEAAAGLLSPGPLPGR